MQRQVVTTHGAITFVGNSLGLNKDSTLDAPGASGSLGTFTTIDTNQRDNPQWPLGTTGDWRLNSSSAVVSVQSGSRVIHAELIWGGSYLFGTEDVSDFLNDPINFTTPAGTTQVTRDPTTAVERSGAQQNYYVRTADVTALVSAAGNGTYTVGRVPATQGDAGSELQRRRLDAGHSLRERQPPYPQPLAVPRPRTTGRRNRLGLRESARRTRRDSYGRASP